MARMRATFHVRAGAPIGRWRGDNPRPVTQAAILCDALARVDLPLALVEHDEGVAVAHDGVACVGDLTGDGVALLAQIFPCAASSLGDPSFCAALGTRFPYVAGAMANGISSAALVESMGRAGMVGFFGAAGLDPGTVESEIERISTHLGALPWGINLIHSPYEPQLEAAIVDLYLRRSVRLVSASAYLGLTPDLVRYRMRGIHRGAGGEIVVPNRVIGKVSRIEVAEKFFSPPSEAMLGALVSAGQLSAEEAELAAHVPMAEDITAEADSGGHTDNRSALAMVPTMMALRDRRQAIYGEAFTLRVGVGGGISTPQSAAAAFAMGAAYVVTGSVNQACVEAGTSDAVRKMLAAAEQADVAMAPAADMFEMGVKLQVLRRGTFFPMRALKLHDLYRQFSSFEEMPFAEREKLEKTVFRASVGEIWAETRRFWGTRDPRQLERAEADPHHRMALIIRWYLGQSSRWANRGEPGREMDYQVWCGPSMGAFNEWVRCSYLEPWSGREAVAVAQNILHGASILARANALRLQGVRFGAGAIDLRPRSLAQLEPYFSASGVEGCLR